MRTLMVAKRTLVFGPKFRQKRPHPEASSDATCGGHSAWKATRRPKNPINLTSGVLWCRVVLLELRALQVAMRAAFVVFCVHACRA